MSLDLGYTPAEDGPTIRFLSALAAPVFPLLALLCCFLVELMKPGLGITAGLQALFFRCTSYAAPKREFPGLCPFWFPSQLSQLDNVTSAGAHALLCWRGLRHISLAPLSTKRRPWRRLEGLEGSAEVGTVMRWFLQKPNSGSQEELPKAFAFRSSMPYFLCEDEHPLKRQVDLVGYAAAVFYILLIPSFLLYLYWRQRAVLRTSGTAMWVPGL